MDIILASTSRYRKALLQRLELPFRCADPGTAEAARPGEEPAALAERLALAKAEAVAADNPDSLVIGSDQVAALDGHVLGKPGNFAAARAQLAACAGRQLEFYTGLALVRHSHELRLVHTEPFTVEFLALDPAAIDNYLRRDQPYDCAGSFRWEGLGIALFRRLHGDDPTALEGLPLIALCRLLRIAGCEVLSQSH